MSERKSVINSKFISHGTLGSRDLAKTRRFYEEYLGFDVVQTSKISMMVRCGGDHIYVVVKRPDFPEMGRINHNGIDVETDADVDEAHKAVLAAQEEWGLKNVSEPVFQHGTYSFHFNDFDGNAWEILSNPRGGYTWLFEQGDLEGKGHWDESIRDRIPAGETTRT
ncbi:MAG: VOC family protein [Alphaproteobacteria bacterium]